MRAATLAHRPSWRSRSAIGLAAPLLAVNLAVGMELGRGSVTLGLLVATLPLLVLVLAWLLAGHREFLVYAVLALPVTQVLNRRLPGTGGTAVWPQDLLVVLALAITVVSGLVTRPRERPRAPATPVLGLPFALLGVAVVVGVLRGHEHYGENYFDQAARLLIYAGIAPALAGLTAERAYRALARIFYAGIVVQVVAGLYYLATGGSQTSSVALSTGGTRALALTSAIWLGAGMIVALLELERARDTRERLLHLLFAGLAVFGVVISFSRTTFVAAGLLVPLLFFAFRRLRRSVLGFLPLALPVALLGTLLALQLTPSLGTTLGDRLSGTPTSDPSLIQRERKWTATLEGFGNHAAFGFGFGRPVQYTTIAGVTVTIDGDPENSYIWMLAGGGIALLGAFILLLLTFFADAVRRALRTTGEARALVVLSMSLAFILLVNSITYPLLSSPPELLALWLAFLLPRLAVAPASERARARGRPVRASVGAEHGRA